MEFDGTFSQPFMTGGAGAGTIAATASSSYPWPPASFTNVAAADMTRLPQYTATGTPITMPAPSFTSADSTKTFNAGNGWFNAAVTPSAHATIAGYVQTHVRSKADMPDVPTLPSTALLALASLPAHVVPDLSNRPDELSKHGHRNRSLECKMDTFLDISRIFSRLSPRQRPLCITNSPI